MKTYLLYQIMHFLMIYKSPCNTQSIETDRRIMETLRANHDNSNEHYNFVNFSIYRHAARDHEYPYHVSVILEIDKSVLCQGVLITFNWMLTSGSCFKRYYNILAKEMYIVAGVVNTTDPMAIIKNISHVVYHPDFKTPVVSSEDYSGETTDSSSTIINDLALVKLKEAIIEDNSGRMKTIELSTQKYPSQTTCNYSSFENDIILYGCTVKLMDLSDCEEITVDPAQKLDFYCASINDTQFITDYDTITSLSHIGTPLVCNNKLYGIKTSDGFFTAVNKIKSWVDSVI